MERSTHAIFRTVVNHLFRLGPWKITMASPVSHVITRDYIICWWRSVGWSHRMMNEIWNILIRGWDMIWYMIWYDMEYTSDVTNGDMIWYMMDPRNGDKWDKVSSKSNMAGKSKTLKNGHQTWLIMASSKMDFPAGSRGYPLADYGWFMLMVPHTVGSVEYDCGWATKWEKHKRSNGWSSPFRSFMWHNSWQAIWKFPKMGGVALNHSF